MLANNCINKYDDGGLEQYKISNISLGVITQAVFFHTSQQIKYGCEETIFDILPSHYNQNKPVPKILEEQVNSIVNIMQQVITNISQLKEGIKIAKRLLAHSPYTFSHSLEVSCIAVLIAKYTGMSEEQQIEVGLAAVLHDIGKLFINDDILHKSAHLTFHEWIKMKKHPYYGYCLIKHSHYFSDEVALAILSHHENNIGNGYPNMLREKEISEYAQIIHIADVFDALTSKRNYRIFTWDYDRAIQYIKNNMGIMFSTKYAWAIVNIFHQ